MKYKTQAFRELVCSIYNNKMWKYYFIRCCLWYVMLQSCSSAKLITTPWMCMGEWMYSSMHLYFGTRWRSVVSSRPSCFTPTEGFPSVNWMGGRVTCNSDLDGVEKIQVNISCLCGRPQFEEIVWSYITVFTKVHHEPGKSSPQSSLLLNLLKISVLIKNYSHDTYPCL